MKAIIYSWIQSIGLPYVLSCYQFHEGPGVPVNALNLCRDRSIGEFNVFSISNVWVYLKKTEWKEIERLYLADNVVKRISLPNQKHIVVLFATSCYLRTKLKFCCANKI